MGVQIQNIAFDRKIVGITPFNNVICIVYH